MPIEVSDILPEATPEEVEDREEEVEEVAAPTQEEAKEETMAPAPKKRGRPPGSKNKQKPSNAVVSEVAQPEPPRPPPSAKANAKAKAKTKGGVRFLRVAPKRVPLEESDESWDEHCARLSPMAQRRAQWAEYRQGQVNAHQARVSRYSKALDRMLAF